jgi:hypothetical protein
LEKINTEKRGAGKKKLILIVREFSATSGWLGTLPIIVFNEENVQSIKYVIHLLVKYSWLMSIAFSFPKFCDVHSSIVLVYMVQPRYMILVSIWVLKNLPYQSSSSVVLIHMVHYDYGTLINTNIEEPISPVSRTGGNTTLYQYQSGMGPEVISGIYLTYISIRFIPTIYQEKNQTWIQ